MGRGGSLANSESAMPIKARAAIALLALVAAVFHPGPVHARNQIRMVGSSTVFPFATTVAERFGRRTRLKTPVVESTGTGGGFKLFCAGIGVAHPDMANASRRIKPSELARCAANGVNEITEISFGFDGIVIANSMAGPENSLTTRQIFLALAKQVPADADGATLRDNPYRSWRDIDRSLPAAKIEVLGPPPTSGTRDAFVELAMEGGCVTFAAIRKLKKTDTARYNAICHGIREDGAYVEAGENDNLIVQKLVANPAAFGIFGFGFLDQNADKVRGATVDGVEPSFENIASGGYGISRSLFVYVKNAHAGVIPGIREFVHAFTSEAAWGEEGYLVDKGLIPLPAAERRKAAAAARKLIPLSM